MYHVGVSNIFELLDDENDEEGKKKVVKPPVKQEAPQTKTKAPVPTGKDQPRKNEPAAPAKGNQQAPRAEKGERSERRFERPAKPEGEGERRGPPRDRRPPRGEAGPAAPSDRPQGERKRDNKEREHGKFQAGKPTKRIYDRKSGTGRGKEVKKGGSGRGGWGKEAEGSNWDEGTTAEQEVKEDVKTEGETPAEPQQPVETEEEKKRREEEERKQKEEEEKEARQMTLEEYNKKKLEEKAEKGTVIPELPAPRKPGEGVDKKELQKWATFTPLKRDEEEEEEEKRDDAEAKKEKKKASKKQPVPADVLRFQAKKPERERREKGSPRYKDSPKGGVKRGGRGAAAPDVGDTSSFPALSTKA